MCTGPSLPSGLGGTSHNTSPSPPIFFINIFLSTCKIDIVLNSILILFQYIFLCIYRIISILRFTGMLSSEVAVQRCSVSVFL